LLSLWMPVYPLRSLVDSKWDLGELELQSVSSFPHYSGVLRPCDCVEFVFVKVHCGGLESASDR
jgi:hypothetical protein